VQDQKKKFRRIRRKLKGMLDACSRSACMGGEGHVMKQSGLEKGVGSRRTATRGDTTGGVKKDARDASQKSAHLARVAWVQHEEKSVGNIEESDTTGGV
jgi:hypothetical protein